MAVKPKESGQTNSKSNLSELRLMIELQLLAIYLTGPLNKVSKSALTNQIG